MITVTPEWLKTIDALKDVPSDQLQWWIDKSLHYIIAEGDDIFTEDELIRATLIIISGTVKFFYMQNGAMRELPEFGPKTITGHLPFSRGRIAGGTGRAISEAQLMEFPIALMPELIHDHFELTQALVHIMTDRVREGTAYIQQHEKMMALGKLSAGLAHELNNPAAAIVRSSTLLKQHLLQQPETFKKTISVQMDAEQVDVITQRMFEVMSRTRQTSLTLMQRSDKEDELTDWLEEHEVENASEVAEHFVEFCFELEDLDFVGERVKVPHLSPVLNWVNNNLVTEKMVTDIQEASQRISDLVGSVKNFTHMDRAQDKQFSDIRLGIRNTLIMLNHKVKQGSVQVIENFDETLPEVNAYIGELNQVWTNIIDNALDAMEGRPDSTLEIKTERDKEFVKVTITDNGPGIGKDDLDKIFDPFFTTKDIGKGTGMGLDVVCRIMKQHHGTIKAQSVPGKTSFVICFPIAG
jgi:signal transduction histidine kinase